MRRAQRSGGETSKELANGKPNEERTRKIPFVVAVALCLQAFTGVCRCSWIWRRCVGGEQDGQENPKIIENPGAVDWWWILGCRGIWTGTADSMARNWIEFPAKSVTRYSISQVGDCRAFDTFKVVPPGIGLVHQVNPRISRQGRSLVNPQLTKISTYLIPKRWRHGFAPTMINGNWIVAGASAAIESFFF